MAEPSTAIRAMEASFTSVLDGSRNQRLPQSARFTKSPHRLRYFPLTRMFAGIFQASRAINRQQARMQTPGVYQPVARDLAILCQSGAALRPTGTVGIECRGYSAGVYLFGARKYSTVVKLCDVLLPVRDNGDSAKAALRDLKAKALAAQVGQEVDFVPGDQMLGFNPYAEVSLDALRSAPAP